MSKREDDMYEPKVFNPIYYLHDDIDTVIDEKGDSFIAFRKVQWARSRETEKDPSKAKYELRRWKVTPEGEVPNKGLTFMTEQGPHNCVIGLIENGFGNTKQILLKVKERKDFKEAVETLYDDSEISDLDGEYFDAREFLLND